MFAYMFITCVVVGFIVILIVEYPFAEIISIYDIESELIFFMIFWFFFIH